jgi:hypothetical protein
VEGESFLGLEVRANDGTDLGRVTDVITDGATGEVTHLVLEWEGVDAEVPLSAVTLDEDGDFATYSPDASDVEPGDHVGDEYKPGDHVGDEYKPGGYSPAWEAIPDQEDYERRGQFVHLGDLDEPPVSPAQVAREDWEDESYEPDSGYPENDAFIDEQTGEETYAYRDGDDLQADVAEVLDSTEVYDDTGIRLLRIVGTRPRARISTRWSPRSWTSTALRTLTPRTWMWVRTSGRGVHGARARRGAPLLAPDIGGIFYLAFLVAASLLIDRGLGSIHLRGLLKF